MSLFKRAVPLALSPDERAEVEKMLPNLQTTELMLLALAVLLRNSAAEYDSTERIIADELASRCGFQDV